MRRLGAHLALACGLGRGRSFALALAPALAILVGLVEARADEGPEVPQAPALPSLLTLDEALRIFHERSLDLLIAEANVMTARGDVLSAGQVYNPNFSFGVGPAFNYNPNVPGCSGCQNFAAQWALSDNGALMDIVVGKRGLRIRGSRALLEAARMTRVDAERVFTAQLKQNYMQIVLARASLDFALEVQTTMTATLNLNKVRYPGVIDEGALARIEVQKLEADQAVEQARQVLRQAQVSLAFLLGIRELPPDFEVEKKLLRFEVPRALDRATERDLLDRAFEQRADLRAVKAQRDAAQAALVLARRQLMPDVQLQVAYTQLGVGQNVGQPMNAVFGLSFNLPIFYQQQGEIRHAQGGLASQELQVAKGAAQVVNDIDSAYAAYVAQREIVVRMEKTLLGRAKVARDILDFQYKKGAATLMDFLDAQRTYIAINVEYFTDLANYWTAVYQLEQAVGGGLL